MRQFIKVSYELTFFIVSTVTLYGMEPLTFAQRKKIAADILATPTQNFDDRQVVDIATTFLNENNNACEWFEEHRKELQPLVQQVANDAEIKIMGSRRWKTSHILSDIDAVVVTESPDRKKVIDALQSYYTKQYPSVDQFRRKTKAGFLLFVLKNFADPRLGEMKIEYTIQSQDDNRTIIEQMSERVSAKFTDTVQKTRYAIGMMAAVYENDTQKQLELKEWTRI